ncbi:MAG: hypothetical protein E3J86_09555 [Candidatus Thorarchaeota archaeon]|nr:MAG: hypothetical protein E3J86_09555 [Candidatus Thorarchaeota archaeon]
MNQRDLNYWLLDNAGPIIRFRTIVDLVVEQDVGVVASALTEMKGDPEVTKWFSLLKPNLGFNEIHSSKQDAYENVMGKLVQLGWRAGLQPFDTKTLPFRVWLSENIDRPHIEPHAVFKKTVIASILARAGYDMVKAVEKQMVSRLVTLYKFSAAPDFSQIFVEKPDTKRMSETEHELVNPELYPNQQFMLPWVHDALAFSKIGNIMNQPEKRKMVESIMEMILSPEYQALPWSYGLAKYGNQYYAIGWAVHLPGYDSKPEGRLFAEMLLMLEALAPFKCIQRSSWFNDSLKYLDDFRATDNTYSFPRAWLSETKTGYWVGGVRMAYDSRTGRKNAIEVESTFRVLMIRKRAGL